MRHPRGTPSSQSPGLQALLTQPGPSHACWRVGREGHAVAQVAGDFGVGWATVMDAVRDDGAPLIGDLARLGGVTALGADETAFDPLRRYATPRRARACPTLCAC